MVHRSGDELRNSSTAPAGTWLDFQLPGSECAQTGCKLLQCGWCTRANVRGSRTVLRNHESVFCCMRNVCTELADNSIPPPRRSRPDASCSQFRKHSVAAHIPRLQLVRKRILVACTRLTQCLRSSSTSNFIRIDSVLHSNRQKKVGRSCPLESLAQFFEFRRYFASLAAAAAAAHVDFIVFHSTRSFSYL